MYYLHHKLNKEKGFTLVELLVSIAIIITAATAVVAILTSTLRGSSKVNALEDVRQIGSNAIFQITKTVQYAEVFEGVAPTNQEYTNNCIDPGEETGEYSYLKVKHNGEIKEISCKDLSINGVSLINNQRVKLSSCTIICEQNSNVDPPVIGINFTLEQRKLETETANLPERGASLEFSTTIKMRNLNE